MSLFEKLKSDKIEAFKAGDISKSNILGVLISDACKYNKNPPDEDVLSLIKKFIENAKEFIALATSRQDLVFNCNFEIAVLSTYLPQQLSADEIRTLIRSIPNAISIPVIMNWFKNNHYGKYDGKLTVQLAKEFVNFIAG